MQARSIIKSFKPDVVVGTGGYVSGPVLRAAVMLGVPTVIQEQNGYPGVTTRVLAPKVNEVHVTFEGSQKYFSRTDNLFVTGNPTRADLAGPDRTESLKFFGLEPRDTRPVLLAFGGSLGANAINRAVAANIAALAAGSIRLIWQTGAAGLEAAKAAAAVLPHGVVSVNAFIDRMDFAYAASDLVLCRAGATTIAELTLLGKPAILVPYPHAAAHHQEENARAMAEAGAAVVLSDDDVAQRLTDAVRIIGDAAKLGEMGARSKSLGKPDAAAEIARHIALLAERGR
jgi:UDP-N-acetylglucosamine--N-acetylmuramyl-(pentapeptide) pyrophosphoryl-undecaprenol N-acetylglucosamine transferase